MSRFKRRQPKQPEPSWSQKRKQAKAGGCKIGGAPSKHGAFAAHVRERYSDARTKEGKYLALTMRKLVEEIGPELSASQSIILDRIAEKLIVLRQIGKFVDEQISIIDKKTGELLPCLGRNYTSYSEALRRDLEALQKMGNEKRTADLYEKFRDEFFKDALEVTEP